MKLLNMSIHLKITLPLWKSWGKSSTGGLWISNEVAQLEDSRYVLTCFCPYKTITSLLNYLSSPGCKENITNTSSCHFLLGWNSLILWVNLFLVYRHLMFAEDLWNVITGKSNKYITCNIAIWVWFYHLGISQVLCCLSDENSIAQSREICL